MNWFWWTISAAAVIGVLWLLGALIVGDRSRGRRRCPKCWHSLEGLPEAERGWTCPECGRVVQNEKDMFRVRRKRRLLAVIGVALLLGSGYYSYGVYQRRAEGWRAWVPSLGAVLLVRPVENSGVYPAWSQVLREVIVARKTTPAFPGWYERVLRWRLVDESEDTAWAHVHIRDIWIKGEPIPVYLSRPDVSGGLHDEWFILNASQDQLQASQFSIGDFDALRALDWLFVNNAAIPITKPEFLMLPPSSESSVTVELQLTARIGDGKTRSTFSGSTRVYRRSFTMRMVESEKALLATGVISPLRDAAIDEAIHLSQTSSFGFPVPFPTHVMIFDFLGKRNRSLPPEYVIAYSIDLMYKGEIYMRGPFQYSFNFYREAWFEEDRAASESTDALLHNRLTNDLIDWVNWHRDPTPLGPEPDMDGWVFRVTPRPDRVLRHPVYSLYWVPADGSPYLEFPLADYPELAEDPNAMPMLRTSPPQVP